MKKSQSLADAVAAVNAPKSKLPNERSIPEGQGKQRQENRVGKKVISGYFDPAVSLQLRQLGLIEGKTVQELLSIALNKLFRDNKLSEIA